MFVSYTDLLLRLGKDVHGHVNDIVGYEVSSWQRAINNLLGVTFMTKWVISQEGE